ncbi:MAG: thioredoxin-disulfide reductase [candidate division TM6 bacterium GW2011_GWE2_36_25]|nr:MAG: thioredoxin-disulfide reductase [candidate division TM6 bacterium GW2011_GWF2_36_131]KKQ03226.1 MAG: thioredoxin-disulfide reductase [candidate division TM6 bacterium GW2011_GWE2_36_25]KKQ19817.1 MAG: thioredoxin-disulfide reductase [candidate division TM6 bacterium GW2011_GWA2_36_9]
MRRSTIYISLILFFIIIVVFLSLWFIKKKSFSLGQLAKKENIVPIAVIGSGPAGLSAGLYGARLGFYTVIFEGPKPGGQLTETGYVENWPGVGRKRGPEIMKDQRAYVESLGAVLMPESISKVDFSSWPYRLTTDDNQVINALSVIIATGSAPRVLAIPGEREYWGKGVTTCAVCDAPYYKNSDVVVIGGGDSAIEEAAQLAPYAKQITILVRKDSLRASDIMQKRLLELPQARVLFNKELKRVYGDEEHVEGVEVYDNKSKEISHLPIKGVFLAIGQEPRTQVFKGQLNLDKQGYVQVKGRTQECSRPGVFAAGDVEDMHYRQAGVAAGAGIKAAIEASQFLQRIGWLPSAAKSMSSRFFEPEKAGPSCVYELTSEADFEKRVLRSSKPVIIDFYAQHCPSCMHMLPIYEAVARKFCNQMYFFKVNTINVPQLEERLHVQRIPCFLVFKDGQQIARYYSIMNKGQMIDFAQQFVG